MSSRATRERFLIQRTESIKKFCDDHKFRLESYNDGYQWRIEDVLDAYPVNGKWHWLPTGERGEWDYANDLRDVMLRLTASVERVEQLPSRKWHRILWSKLWLRK